jgi:hypothetical protein
MAEVAYGCWSLIPKDFTPASQEPTLTQPPMLTTILVDPGASLHFELAAVAVLSIQITITGLSGEARESDFLRVYRGTAWRMCCPGCQVVTRSGWSERDILYDRVRIRGSSQAASGTGPSCRCHKHQLQLQVKL